MSTRDAVAQLLQFRIRQVNELVDDAARLDMTVNLRAVRHKDGCSRIRAVRILTHHTGGCDAERRP